MKPLEYGRKISINLLPNQEIEYVVSQPITFKERTEMSTESVGACRIVSTFKFDANMQCLSVQQEVKAAEILGNQ